jgi:uncharacterized protein (DUF433 family)
MNSTQSDPGFSLPDFLTAKSDGLIVFRDHRIGLEDVVYFFNEGYSPEMLAGQYPTLPLPVIYKAIGFYLDNRDAVDTYVARTAREIQDQRSAASNQPGVEELRRRMEKLHRSEVT